MDQEQASNELTLSIVVPAYNEDKRLPYALDCIVEYFGKKGLAYEVIVVDDGSKDNTKKVVGEYNQKYQHIKLHALEKNSGKGAAVAAGVMKASGKWILYQDADGATPIEEIERLFREMETGADVAIGSRALFSQDTEVTTVWYRKLMGRTFNAIVNIFVLPGINDTQCGFKMFTRKVAHHIFPRIKSHRYAFDVEMLYLARKIGCSIAEVPINWNNIPGSKVNLLLDSADMFMDILSIPFRDYGKLTPVSELK